MIGPAHALVAVGAVLAFATISLHVVAIRVAQYQPQFYYDYLGTWPEYCQVFESFSGVVAAYVLGKVEGSGKLWHGHVSAVTVSPEFRRLGMAKELMQSLETTTDEHRAWFVDLFVRESNTLAINMYKRLGYTIFRRVLSYYGDNNEDAFDMRKPSKRDTTGASSIPMTRPVQPYEIVFD